MSEKRDWFQIIVNTVMVIGFGLMAYQAFMHPREALNIVLAVAGTMAFVGVLGLAGMLIGKVLDMVAALICRIDDKRRGGEPSDFSLADRMRLWLLAKPWLASWLPHQWDALREGLRRSRCCELIACWEDPEHMFEGHKVCSRHYAELLELKAASEHRLRTPADGNVPI